MVSPVAQAYSDADRRLSPYLRHSAPRLVFPGLEIQAHPDFARTWPLWATVRDCYAGEHTVKAAGQTYLRKLSAHKPEEYEAFLSRSYFYNAVRRTAVGLMGSLFRKPPEFTLPKSLTLDLENVTLDSQSATEFLRTAALEIVLTGRYGILVDLPRGESTQPYLAGYPAESVYSWRVVQHRGRRIVDRVVLREQEVVLTEYGEELRDVVRVLRLDPDPDGVEPDDLIYSQQIIRPGADEKQPPVTTDIPITILGQSLDYIPFVFVNATDLLTGVKDPPLLDIATINISHYQSTALLEHARFYAGMPTYVTSAGEGGAGLPDDPTGTGTTTMNALTVGPSNVWELEQNAKAWILEFNGHGLTFLENAVDSKQLQMQSLGGKLISAQRRAAALSSEAWALLETGDEATLMDVAVNLEKAMGRALTYLAEFSGKAVRADDPVVVELNKEFVRTDLTARELRAIQALYERQIIPLDVLYYALREVNVIPIEYSLEDFKKLMSTKEQLYEPPVVEASYTGTASRPGAPASRPPANAGSRPTGTGGGSE